MIRGTKLTLEDSKVRPTEFVKMESVKKGFAALDITGCGRSVPGS
jgi:hypothetical protein